jgi:signal transduction histidine kinase
MITRLSATRVAIDVGVAFVYLVVGVALNGTGSLFQSGIVFVFAVALGFRRFSPLIALAICWGAALVQMYFAHIGPVWPDLAILAVMYTTAAYGDRATRWIGFGSIFVGAILGGIYLEWGTGTPTIGVSVTVRSIADAARTLVNVGFDFVLMLGVLGAPWAAGTIVRTRMAARDSRLAEQAAQSEMEAAEQDVIVEQERNRIARDMHDVVAHSLAVVIAQADGARYAQANDPTAVDGALTAISTTARDALADVRLLLGQLRHPQTEGPQPALADLSRLLEQLRASGLKTEFETKGTPLVLGTGQQLAVYRIVQEALTNALRHGDVSQPALVRFVWTPDDLEVTISSAVIASPATAELRLGHGLAGMKERAALVGGRLSATSDDKYFVVIATIPSTQGVRA